MRIAAATAGNITATGLGTPVDLKTAGDRPRRNYTLTASALLAHARKNLILTLRSTLQDFRIDLLLVLRRRGTNELGEGRR